MSVDELAQSCADLAYVMPSHQFPCGVTMPIRRRMELLTWAEGGQERYVIEDDYDSEFRYRGKPVPALQSLDRSGRVIHIGTFSKSLTPAIRISYLVLPQQLVARYEQNAGFLASTVSRIDQAVLQAFVADGHFERHLNKSRKVYRQKHDVLMDALTPLRERFNISGDAAGLHVILRPNQETGIKKAAEAELLAGAEKEGCKVYGMSAYAAGERLSEETEETALLIGYASLSVDQIRAGVEALVRAWL
jgi:GntR family transcriptional regulator/MocR family aminotransferase